jgi:UrcA family protein
VHTADLDLRSDAGATALRHRVHSAARAVCGEPGRFGDPESEGYDTCVRAAEEGALIASDRLIASVRTEVRVASAQSVP